MVDVSIIIVNYKTCKLVENCIESIIKFSENFSYEIIVVDNSEDKKEFFQLKELENDSIKIIDAKKNLGFGKANNLGVENSNSKFIHFLNSDTILLNNAIYEMIKLFEQYGDCGIVGSNLYNENNEPTHSFTNSKLTIKQIKKNNSCFELIKRNLLGRRNDFNYTNKNIEVNCDVIGASLMIRRCDFDGIGGFDERIFMYAEETLLCTQVQKQLNKKIYNAPNSKIIHLEGASDSNIYSQFKMSNFIKGNYIYHLSIHGEKYASKVLKVYKKIFYKKYIIASIFRKKVLMKNSKGYYDTIKYNKW